MITGLSKNLIKDLRVLDPVDKSHLGQWRSVRIGASRLKKMYRWLKDLFGGPCKLKGSSTNENHFPTNHIFLEEMEWFEAKVNLLVEAPKKGEAKNDRMSEVHTLKPEPRLFPWKIMAW